MPRTLYVFDLSPPARAAWMACRAAEIDVDVKILDSLKKEHNADWFVKISPKRCIPTLDDDGFVIWESRTIMRYAVDSYGKKEKLYPKDLKQRALVDRMLDYDCGTLSKTVSSYVSPILFESKSSDSKHERQLCALLNELDRSLKGQDYLVGDELTLADISIVTTVTFLEAIGFDFNNYEHLLKWINRCKGFDFYTECNKCFEEWKEKAEDWKKSMKGDAAAESAES